MLKINEIVIDTKETLGDLFYLMEVREMKNFDTKETEGTIYEVVSDKTFEKINVKVKGNFKEKEKELPKKTKCTFEDLKLSIWQDSRSNNEIKFSASAGGIKHV